MTDVVRISNFVAALVAAGLDDFSRFARSSFPNELSWDELLKLGCTILYYVGAIKRKLLTYT